MESDIRSKTEIAKKILKIVFKVLYNLLVVACVLLIAIIVLQKITDSNRSVGGYRIFRVITGSMLPEYDVGEVVISKETNPNNIKVGDDIVYKGTYGDYSGKIIMHKVTQIDVGENNDLTFHAQGLHSSSVEDPQIKSNQIYGVVKFKSKMLSILYKLATSIYSSFIIIIVLVLNVFLSFKFSGKEVVHQLGESADNINENVILEENDINTEIENDDKIDDKLDDKIDEKIEKKENESQDEQ